jgi:hypothetical protein
VTTVYVLGSGFSKALAPDHMPVMAELSAAVQHDLERLGQPPIPGASTPLATDFERWLSYLIEAPPWVSAGWHARNEGAFADITASVHRVLSSAQQQASTNPPPTWLEPLVGHWETSDAIVITFNYDQLVEMTWLTSPYRRPPSSLWNLYPVPIAPIALRISGTFGPEARMGGMRLLKLHGSLGWYHSGPGSPSGDPVYETGVSGGWGTGIAASNEANAYLIADKHPLIVPPAAVKSPYYSNAVLRSVWSQAADALVAADTIVIMGFSFPATDQIVGALFATTVRQSATLVPVDRDPNVADRLVHLFTQVDGTIGERFIDESYSGGDDAIARWVAANANPGPAPA